MKRLCIFSLGVILVSCSTEIPFTQIQGTTAHVHDWSGQPAETITHLKDIQFNGVTNGWVVGDGNVLLATSNGGVTWPQVPIVEVDTDFSSIFFLNEQTGWLTGNTQIFRSSMGGAYPTSSETASALLNTIHFVDAEFGWAGGDQGVILHTTDGGINWASDPLENLTRIFDFHFSDRNKGWAATGLGIYRTKMGRNGNRKIQRRDLPCVPFIFWIHSVAGHAVIKIPFLKRKQIPTTSCNGEKLASIMHPFLLFGMIFFL